MTRLSERWREAYTERADVYERLDKAYQPEVPWDQLINGLTPLAGKVVLDVGTGPGSLAISLARMAKKVYALEPSHQMVSIITSKIKDQGICNIDVLEDCCEKITLPDSTVDVAVASHSLSGVLDVQRCVSEVERVLVDGGHIYAVENWAFEKNTFQKMREPDSVEYDRSFVELMMNRGFEPCKVFKVHWEFLSVDEAVEVMGFLLGQRAVEYLTGNGIRRVDNTVCLLHKKIVKRQNNALPYGSLQNLNQVESPETGRLILISSPTIVASHKPLSGKFASFKRSLGTYIFRSTILTFIFPLKLPKAFPVSEALDYPLSEEISLGFSRDFYQYSSEAHASPLCQYHFFYLANQTSVNHGYQYET